MITKSTAVTVMKETERDSTTEVEEPFPPLLEITPETPGNLHVCFSGNVDLVSTI